MLLTTCLAKTQTAVSVFLEYTEFMRRTGVHCTGLPSTASSRYVKRGVISQQRVLGVKTKLTDLAVSRRLVGKPKLIYPKIHAGDLLAGKKKSQLSQLM
jgi:hypothetical protein